LQVRVEPSVSLVVDGRPITHRQLEVLEAVHLEGSQNLAAERLGIATPVLHRYLSALEAKVGHRLVETTARGSRLTVEGRRLLREFTSLRERVRGGETVVVGCTPITQELLFSCLSKGDRDGFDLVISDDERNLKDFRAGLMDLVVVDDPLYVFESEAPLWEEVAEDHLVHVRRGEGYMRFRYGAQRIGFRHLEAEGARYTIRGTTLSIPHLLRSNLSFFLNGSLVARKGLGLRSSTDPSLLRHKIIAMIREESDELRRLMEDLRRHRL